MKVQNVPLDKIERPKISARLLIEPDAVRELAESIKEQGLIQPIILRKNGDRFEIVAGDRRFLAHQMLGLKLIAATVKDMTDDECFRIRATENLQRENLSPLEEALIYQEMKERYGLSLKQVAHTLGKSEGNVVEKVRLLEFPDHVQKAVHERKLALKVAIVLNRIEDPGIKNMYFNSAIENGITIKTAELWYNEFLKTTEGRELSARKVQEIEFSLMRSHNFGACDICEQPKDRAFLKALVVCTDCLKIMYAPEGGGKP